jgi:hypothetical protein
MSIAELPDPTEPVMEDLGNLRREYGRTSLETPVIPPRVVLGVCIPHKIQGTGVRITPSERVRRTESMFRHVNCRAS